MTDQISEEERQDILRMIADLNAELSAKSAAFMGRKPDKRRELLKRSQDRTGIELARHEADRGRD